MIRKRKRKKNLEAIALSYICLIHLLNRHSNCIVGPNWKQEEGNKRKAKDQLEMRIHTSEGPE